MRSKFFLLSLALWGGLAFGQPPQRSTTAAGNPGLGLGIILGEPTGFTGKVWLQNNRAIDFGVAYSFGNTMQLYADYLFQWPGAFRLKSGEKFFEQLVPYVGVGAAVIIATSSPAAGVGRRYWGTTSGGAGAGVRIPLGIEWLPGDPPLGVFLEIAPGVGFIPATFVFFQGGIGARYYF